MIALRMNHPGLDRHRWEGWICSVAFHGLMAAGAVAALSEIRLFHPEDPFMWNVALVEPPPPQPKAEPQPELRPKPSPPKPAIAQPRPANPEPLQQRVVQETPPVQQVVHRQLVHTTSPVTSVNQTATVLTQAVQQQKMTTQTFAPVEAQEKIVRADTVVATTSPVMTEAPAIKQVAEAVVERSAPDVMAERTALHPQPMVTRQALDPVVERTAVERLDTPPASLQQAVVAQAPPARTVPAAKADYGWLMKALTGRIEQLKNYPHLARLNHWEGKVVLRAVIQEDGQVLAIDVQESSGRSILDDAAIETLRRASPLKLEHPLGKPQVAILMPISYSLRR